MMTRRKLAASAAMIGAAGIGVAALGACTTQTQAQLQTDVETLNAGVAGLLAAVEAIPNNGLSATAQAQIQAAIQDVQTNASAIAAALTPSATVLQGVQTAIATLNSLLTPFFPLSSFIAAAAEAAVALVGTIVSEAGATASAKLRVSMTPDQARVILRGIAAQH